jgi:nucleobase:cation symporter-1, NCS1 family
VAGAVAAYAVFSSHFYTLLSDFLLFIILWLGPWCAIFLVDSYLRRNRYDHDALLNESRGSRYFRSGGVYWPAIIAQIVGMGCAALWLNAYSPYVGFFASRNGGPDGSDFSVFIGLFVGGIIYYALARGRVRAEAEETPLPAAAVGT